MEGTGRRHPSIDEKQRDYCGGTPTPLVLRNADSLHDLKFRDIVTFENDVDPKIKSFPILRPSSRRITQEDFPSIIEMIKSENLEMFGEGAGEPGRDIPAGE